MRLSITIMMLLILMGCASPRYTYYFPQPQTILNQPREQVTLTPLVPPPGPNAAYASTAEVPVATAPAKVAAAAPPAVKGKALPNDAYCTPVSGGSNPALPIKSDPDLRRSVIFAAGGLVALIIGGNVFWVVGSLSLMIGLIFGIKWLLRK